MVSELTLNIISTQKQQYAQHVNEKRIKSLKSLQSAFIYSSKTRKREQIYGRKSGIQEVHGLIKMKSSWTNNPSCVVSMYCSHNVAH